MQSTNRRLDMVRELRKTQEPRSRHNKRIAKCVIVYREEQALAEAGTQHFSTCTGAIACTDGAFDKLRRNTLHSCRGNVVVASK